MNFIRFKTFYLEKIWGGPEFASLLNRGLDKRDSIGESWEISDRPGMESVAIGGRFDNLDISEILKTHTEYLMGYKYDGQFPVMVKWIYASSPLSIQVHPNEAAAKILGAEQKNENWFVAAAKPAAELVAGFKESVKALTAEEMQSKWMNENLRRINVVAGDSVFIPGGCVHAIGGGILILEIQENSDTTYRLYDWDRKGPDGKPRALHIKESAICADVSIRPQIVKTGKSDADKIICQSQKFDIEYMSLKKGQKLKIMSGRAKIISVVGGRMADGTGNEILFSENVLVPAVIDDDFTALEDSQILLTKIK